MAGQSVEPGDPRITGKNPWEILRKMNCEFLVATSMLRQNRGNLVNAIKLVNADVHDPQVQYSNVFRILPLRLFPIPD